jgi:hypothetical protein
MGVCLAEDRDKWRALMDMTLNIWNNTIEEL